ncbi:MAG: ATP-binding cassette domain-containing protein [Myxococcota bacterium]
MIEVSGVRKTFGAVVAVDDVSFQAPNGRITGLLGPNGAGKTTALRVLSGMLVPDAGTARIDEVDVVADPNAGRARLGLLPDARGLYPRLTARENIRYFGELYGMTGARLHDRVAHLIDLLELGPVADRAATGFSQGERMKVAIARALVHDPPNVVLDEPTNGLDVMSIRALRAFLARLRDEGRCVLFSSHVMQEVSALCDEIVIISSGRVVASGTEAALREATGAATMEDVFVAVATS